MAREKKDSGIEWIGKVPIIWKVSKIKYELECKDELRQPISADKRERNNPQYDYYGASGIIDKIDSYNVDDEVLLIGEDGANLLMRNLPLIYKAKGKFWVNNHAHILKPTRDNNYDYLAFLLESGDYTNHITGSAQPKLSQSNLMSFYILQVPVDEQEKIANYLDKKCTEIDALLSDIQSQIDILENYKKSVITEAVTKGLNPNVEMKDSGIEWIGKIPILWSIHPVSFYFDERKNKNIFGKESNLLSLSYGRIIRKDINSNMGLLPETFNTYNIVEKNDIIIRPTDLQNDKKSLRTGLVRERGVITSAYIALKSSKRINAAYFHYLLHVYDITPLYNFISKSPVSNIDVSRHQQ